MKMLFLILAMLTCNVILSQKNHFVRIYDNNKHKIAKGQLQSVNDSSIFIAQLSRELLTEIPFSKIGYIRLKRSAGHTIGMTTLYMASTYAILGLATGTNDPKGWFSYTPVEGFVFFGVFGAIQGAITGTAAAGIKGIIGKKIIIVKEDFNNWKSASKQLNGWLKK